MRGYLIDASAAVEYLPKTPLGMAAADLIRNARLAAPELLDADVLSVLRRAVPSGSLEERRALMALDDLPEWPIDGISVRALTRRAWRHHRNISAHDALHVAAAEARRLPLLTTDRALARAPGANDPGADDVVQRVHLL